MDYIVSARKYRPATFESVVGQSNITSTLKNVIKNQQLAHAYLFCGPRGVGKTTCARIFSKTINCSNITSDYEACNECDSCRSFNENRSYNIHELDAASNNSVDDIRLLIDKVRVPPQMGRYSVYIIDEVHMLSAQAFNAFLKTLEEPPRHAIFIMATTEKHKILPTILSRCQTFDFNRISVEDAVSHLKYVAQKEGVTAEEEGLNVIAQKADGAMRDALSIFDQIVAFSGKNITYQQVITNLNVLDYDYYFKMTDAFLEGDTTGALLIFNDILNAGFDAGHFIAGLCSHFRDLLMCKDPATVQLMEVGEAIRQKYAAQATRCEMDILVEALEIATGCDIQFRNARNKRLHVEFALIRLSRLPAEKKKSSNQVAEPEPRSEIGGTKHLTEKTEDPRPTSAATAGQSVPPSSAPKTLQSTSIHSFVKPAPPPSVGGGLTGRREQPASSAPEPPPARRKSFNQDDLQRAWLDFARPLKSTDPRLFSMLSAQIPSLKGDHVIVFKLKNDIQEKELWRVKSRLMDHIRDALQNDAVVLETEKAPGEETTAKVYTAVDKLRVMMERNPALGKMKEVLKLDLE